MSSHSYGKTLDFFYVHLLLNKFLYDLDLSYESLCT